MKKNTVEIEKAAVIKNDHVETEKAVVSPSFAVPRQNGSITRRRSRQLEESQGNEKKKDSPKKEKCPSPEASKASADSGEKEGTPDRPQVRVVYSVLCLFCTKLYIFFLF